MVTFLRNLWSALGNGTFEGGLQIVNLPTTKPATAGYLWNNGGVVNVS